MADPYGLPDDDMVGAGAGRGGYDPRDRDWEDELVAARPERPAVTYEYAILSLEPREFDRVTLPDRTVQDVRRNHGMSVLESWFDMHVRSETDFQAAAAQQAWQARYAAWRSRVLVTRGRGPGNPRAGMPTGPVDVIRMPNGSVHSAPLGEADRLLLAHYTDTVEREPRVSAVSFDDWLHTANVQIDTGRGWQATLQTDERSEPLGYAVGSDGSGPPVREIALSALNHLGREGWELMSVDDDRNSVMGDLNGRPAPVRTINYLLKRANQASFAPLTPDLASADLRL
jgi:hypothetical protein